MDRFDVEQIKDTCLTKFSSPSGDGLIHDIAVLVDDNAEVFVPEWGWVGSYYCFETNYPLKIFSSPLGDGVVR
ncbi:hypothetical protein [Ruminococcus bromii]|uniref:hypothetical protein n=1 Tax=Ruminococcus bromii TaxID=40518 RepID=UPI003F65C34F